MRVGDVGVFQHLYRGRRPSDLRRPRVWVGAVVATVLFGACETGDGQRPARTSVTEAPKMSARELVTTGSCERYEPSAGVDRNTVRVGYLAAQSGALQNEQALIVGAQARFDIENAKGGVKGRQLELVARDTRSKPQEPARQFQELAQGSEVMAVMGVPDEADSLALRSAAEEACLPYLSAAGRSDGWADVVEYPWSISARLPFADEFRIAFQALASKSDSPVRSVGVILEADRDRLGVEAQIQAAADAAGISVVGVESYDPRSDTELSKQMAALRAKSPDALVVNARGQFCAAPFIDVDWEPQVLLTGDCVRPRNVERVADVAEGAFAVRSLGASVPARASDISANPPVDDADLAAFEAAVAVRGDLAVLDLDLVAWGWNDADILIAALTKAPELTRESLMESLFTMSIPASFPLADSWDVATRSNTDPFLIDSGWLGRYEGGVWVSAS